MLKQRILTALALLVLMLLMLFTAAAWLWAAFAALICLSALWEYGRLCALSTKRQLAYVGGTALFMLTAYAGGWQLPSMAWLPVAAFWLLAAPAWLYYRWPVCNGSLRSIALGWLMLLPFWFALLLLREQQGAGVLLALMLLVWVADVAAYFVGRRWGRHKLAVSISPGKSWEGAIGGMAAVAVYALLANACGWFGSYGLPLLAALLLAALSIVGDLLESLFKRTAGVKDSGHLLPGHGGVLDRIDGLIAVVAVYAAALVWQ